MRLVQIGIGWVTLAFIMAIASPSTAWGPEGHQIVAKLAADQLKGDPAEAKIATILQGASMDSVASWADDIRNDRPETYNWHFVDIPLSESSYDPSTECAASDKGDCAVAEIERLEKDLPCQADATTQEEDLKFLIHFVGDVHQPLHTVEDNRGENDLKVKVLFAGLAQPAHKPSRELHGVWDSTLIDFTAATWEDYVTRLESDWIPSHGSAVSDLNVIDWVLEAHHLAQTEVADVPASGVLDQEYYDHAVPVLDEQLGRAGLRLAALLQKLLDHPASCN